MKNPLTLAGIEPATFRFVAQHLNHCATAVPRSNLGPSFKFYFQIFVENIKNSSQYSQNFSEILNNYKYNFSRVRIL